ncbi:hypothetical protein PRIC1_013191 [Phytophthora ramorum]
MATPGGDKPLYPQIPRAQQVSMNIQNGTSRDEEVARQLQTQYDQDPMVAVAQAVPQAEMPYKCGNCGTTHVVRNVTHGSTFQCTVCGAQNQILMEHRRPVIVSGRSYSVLPIPIFCSIM